MNGRRAAIGLCMLCALLVSAVVAPGAQAETTAFTCSTAATTKTWGDAHCNGTAGTDYGHEAIAEDVSTTVTVAPGTFLGGEQRLKATVNGIPTELITTGISGSGTMKNTKVGGLMVATGTGTIKYTGVTVAKPAGKSCKVYNDKGGVKGTEGVVETEELTATTDSAMGLKFSPVNTEGVFARFIMGGCSGSAAVEGLNKTYTVNGSVTGVPNGGETKFEHAPTTVAETFKLNGSIKTGFEGGLTIKGENGNALAATTPEDEMDPCD